MEGIYLPVEDLLTNIRTLQKQINDALNSASGDELGSLVEGLIELTRNPINLKVNSELVTRRYSVNRGRIDKEYAFNILRMHLSQSDELNYSSEKVLSCSIEGSPPNVIKNISELEFSLRNYDAILHVSYISGMLRIKPEWGKEQGLGLKEIEQCKPKRTVRYEIPLQKLDEELPKVETELVKIFKDLTDYVNKNLNKKTFNPNDINTGQYRAYSYVMS